MAIFPVVDDVAQTTTDVPSSPTFLGGIAFNAAGLVHITDTASSIYVNGIPVSATGQVVYVDASAGLPAGTVYVNGLPISGGAVCMSSNAVAFYSNGLPYDINGAIVAMVSWSPLSLFASGEQGVWYDPSDFSTLFQDAAGTTPVTTTGQAVGLMLDKSKGLTLGTELVTNGDFAGGLTTGWTGYNCTLSVVDGYLKASATGNDPAAYTAVTTVIGKSYNVRITNRLLAFTGSVPGSYTCRAVNTTPYTNEVARVTMVMDSVEADYSMTFLATAATTYISVVVASISDGVNDFFGFDNISVKELPGNHATQATTASKPTLEQDANGKYYLAFDGVDDYMATAAVDFTATDKIGVFAGVLRSVTGAIVSTSSGLTGFAVLMAAVNGGFRADLKDATKITDNNSVNTPYVYSVSFDASGAAAADEVKVRKNGVATGAVAAAGPTSGNQANQPLIIGDWVSAFKLNGRIYQLIIRGALTDAAGITAAETFVNTKTAAY